MTAQARKLRGQDGGGEQDEQDRQSSEQRVSWLELFFDLVFSAAFDRLAQRLGTSLDLHGFGVFSLLFVALWWAWIGNTNFAARYGNASRLYRWGTLAQMLTLAAMAVGMRGDLSDVGTFFALAYAAGRGVLVLMYLARAREGEGLSAGERRLVLGFSVGAALWLGSAFLGGGAQVVVWVLALATDVGSTVLSERRHDREMPHQGHFPERVGLLFIVLLGAVVTELVRGSAEQPLTLTGQLPSVLAFMTIVLLWRLYFDEAHTLPALLANLSGRTGALFAWTYTHLPLMLALGVLSTGFELGVARTSVQADRHERLLVGGALAAIFVSLALLRTFSAGPLRPGASGTGGAAQQPDGASSTGLSSTGASQAQAETVKEAAEAVDLPRRSPVLSLSGLVRLGAAALLLGLTRAPLGTLAYQAVCVVVTFLVAYLSWRDPLQGKLAEIETRLSEASQEEDGDDGSQPQDSGGGMAMK